MDATAEELIARLRRNPDDASAYAALRAHYQRIGDYPSLANLLEGWAARSPDHAAAAQAFFDAGEIAWGALGDRNRSMRLYERALERNPVHAEAGLRLQSMYEEAGDQRRLAELLERRAEALARTGAEPRDVAALHHRLGEIWEHAFARADKAIVHYRKAFELDPSLVPAIYAAREIYRNAGNVKAAATLCDLEAKAEPDPARKVALLRELAHVRSNDLGDLEGGVIALKRALGFAPGDLDVMQDLARVYLARAERTADPMVADADRRRAADVLYQIAQRVPPADAVAHLEAALDAAPDHDGALGLLERIADRVGHFELLPRRWVAFLARAPDAPGAKERRKRLAQAYLEAGQIDYAITCFEWLLEEGDADAAARLVDLYRRVGRDQDVLRALAVAARGLPPHERIPRLREMVEVLRAQGDEAGAIASAREILEIDPADPEALTMLEEHHRKHGEWGPLRELLLAASRVPGLSVDARKQRLREVAQISERRLADVDGAIGAWKGVAALDPADREARAALMRLLEQTERWDDLVQVLEREALSILDPAQKAEIYRRLAQIHREHRNDLGETIAALRNLRDLLPADPAGRDALCDALLAAHQFEEAIPMLRARIDEARPPQRAALLRTLARVLEERVGDEEGAFASWARLLEDEPGDREALERMEAIDVRSGNAERLLTTLSYRADIEEEPARAAIYARMARIADERLRDLTQAAELYQRAYELVPGDRAVLDALCDVYDRAERYRDLVLLLRERARREDDRPVRADLYRRIARILRARVGNDEGAAEAYREVLQAGEDREALEFLRDRARAQDDLPGLDEMLERLANLVEETNARRDALMERAALLADRLGRPRDAVEVLRTLLDRVDPHHLPALGQLANLCERLHDGPGLADALERTLAILEDPDLRVPVARRLADLYEHELRDPARAITALQAWADSDLTEPEPVRRLVVLLEAAERWKDLVAALDTLADMTEDPAEVGALVRRAAEIAYRRLGDVDGAWERLVPRVRLDDGEAETQLRELARAAGLGARLVELYVAIAESADEPATARRRWMDAARAREEYLNDPAGALEGMLKAFALDLDGGSDAWQALLGEVDRLATAARAWPRLAQVYETLIRRAEDRAQKVALLLRHAEILDRDAEDPSAALDRALRACSLAPGDDAVLAVAEDLAPRAGRAEELLVVYDRRRAAASDDAGLVEALLRAVRLAEDALGDRKQALAMLAQAVALSVRSPALAPTIEDAVRALDRELGRSATDGLLRGLVDVYSALAEDMEADPKGGAQLLLRAAALLESELDDQDGAWGALLRATSFAPSEDTALDALGSLAARSGQWGALERHLATLVEDALDPTTAAKLLRRRGRVLERLGRHGDAADVYAHLKNVAPNDAEARTCLRESLRRAGKHQELLLALDNDIARARGDRETEIALRKEVARTWERELKNRWEAIEAWQAVLQLAPDDRDAQDALARLEQKPRTERGSALRSDESLELALAETSAMPLGRVEPSSEFTDPGLDAPPEPGLDDEPVATSPTEPPDSFEALTPVVDPLPPGAGAPEQAREPGWPAPQGRLGVDPPDGDGDDARRPSERPVSDGGPAEAVPLAEDAPVLLVARASRRKSAPRDEPRAQDALETPRAPHGEDHVPSPENDAFEEVPDDAVQATDDALDSGEALVGVELEALDAVDLGEDDLGEDDLDEIDEDTGERAPGPSRPPAMAGPRPGSAPGGRPPMQSRPPPPMQSRPPPPMQSRPPPPPPVSRPSVPPPPPKSRS